MCTTKRVTNVTIRIPFERHGLRGLYVTLLPVSPFLGRYSAHGYTSFGLGLMTVQWVS